MSHISTKCRFYKQDFPVVGETVIVQFISGSEYGYTVSLLEYNNIEGFITLADMFRKTRHRTKRLAKIGQQSPMSVTSIDIKKKLINLSKKFITKEDIINEQEIYNYKQNLHRFGLEIYHLYNNYNKSEPLTKVEDILNKTTWRLIEERKSNIEESAEEYFFKDLYNEVLDSPQILLDNSFPEEFSTKLLNNISGRVQQKHVQMEMLIKILMLDKGVDSLKHVLIFKFECPPKYKVNVSMTSSPIYTLSVEGPDEEECKTILNSLAKKVKDRVKEKKGMFSVYKDSTIISQTEKTFKFISIEELNNLVL